MFGVTRRVEFRSGLFVVRILWHRPRPRVQTAAPSSTEREGARGFVRVGRGLFEVAVARDLLPVEAEVEREAFELRLPFLALRAVLLPRRVLVVARLFPRLFEPRERLLEAATPALFVLLALVTREL